MPRAVASEPHPHHLGLDVHAFEIADRDAPVVILFPGQAYNRKQVCMTSTLVDLGIGGAADFFREVAWQNHVAFGRQPSTIAALNAAWAYWHLHEWHFWDRHPSTLTRDQSAFLLNAYRRHMLSECLELRWLRDMIEAWKHRRLHRADVRVRAISPHALGPGLGTAPIGTTPLGGSITSIVVEVEGTTRNFETVLEAASSYWRHQLGLL
jgi:hypothetical protein